MRDDVTEQHSAPRMRRGGKEELTAAASSCGRENKLGREISGEHNKSEVWSETVEDVSEDISGESDESDDGGEETENVDDDFRDRVKEALGEAKEDSDEEDDS